MNPQVLLLSCELLLISLEEVLKAESDCRLSRQNACHWFNGYTEVDEAGIGV